MDCNSKAPAEEPNIWTLTDQTFDQALSYGYNILVDFYAPWCKACVIFAPKYREAALEAARRGFDVIFAKVNVDENPYLTQRFGIDTFPRLLLFSGGHAGCPRRYFKDFGLESSRLIKWLDDQCRNRVDFKPPYCDINQFICYDYRFTIATSNVSHKTRRRYRQVKARHRMQ